MRIFSALFAIDGEGEGVAIDEGREAHTEKAGFEVGEVGGEGNFTEYVGFFEAVDEAREAAATRLEEVSARICDELRQPLNDEDECDG